MRACLAILACVLVALAVGGCGGDNGDSSGKGGGNGGGDVHLSIVASDGRGHVRRDSVVCSDTGGDGRCVIARRLADFLASKPDPRRACTEIYGGPERARVTGTIAGRAVDRRFSRTNGCDISDWERAQPLIPVKPSAAGLRP